MGDGEVYRVLVRGGVMKSIFVLLLCLGLCGCMTMATKINSISLGMSKEEVIKKMGDPVSTSAQENTEYLSYLLGESSDGIIGYPIPYYVCLREGQVISYGRKGDFDSTKDPTQVIKIMGDIKSNEKINVQTNNNDELTNKLKTLNKLLTDGLITKNEFDEQKKKLLNDYTSKP